MNVQARFKVTEIKHVGTGSKEIRLAVVTMNAVYGDGKGNESWSKATPSGKIEMNITNPAAIEALVVDQVYQITFAPVD